MQEIYMIMIHGQPLHQVIFLHIRVNINIRNSHFEKRSKFHFNNLSLLVYQTKRKKNKSKKKRNKNKTATGKRRKRYIPRDIKKRTNTIENSSIDRTPSTTKFGLKEDQPGFDVDEEIQFYDIEDDNEIGLDGDDLLDMVIFDRNPYHIFSLKISSFSF